MTLQNVSTTSKSLDIIYLQVVRLKTYFAIISGRIFMDNVYTYSICVVIIDNVDFSSGSTFNYIHVKMIGKKIDFHFFPSSE